MICASNDLWVSVLRSKYIACNNNEVFVACQNSSTIWRGISKVWKIVKEGLGWSLGDSKQVNFWLDKWTSLDMCLKDLTIANVPAEHLSRKVNHYVDIVGNCNWLEFQHLLPPSTLMHIAAIKPPQIIDGPDTIFWGHSSNGKFSVCSAYDVIISNSPYAKDP